MTPKRLWLNKIPTLCDVVIEFPGIFVAVYVFAIRMRKHNEIKIFQSMPQTKR